MYLYLYMQIVKYIQFTVELEYIIGSADLAYQSIRFVRSEIAEDSIKNQEKKKNERTKLMELK